MDAISAIFQINTIVLQEFNNPGKVRITKLSGYRTPDFQPSLLEVVLGEEGLLYCGLEFPDKYSQALWPKIQGTHLKERPPYNQISPWYIADFGVEFCERMKKSGILYSSKKLSLMPKEWGEDWNCDSNGHVSTGRYYRPRRTC